MTELINEALTTFIYFYPNPSCSSEYNQSVFFQKYNSINSASFVYVIHFIEIIIYYYRD